MELKDFDTTYRDSIKLTFDKLVKVHKDIADNYKFDLTKTEITEAILDRLKNYFTTQDQTKTFLNKRYKAAGADYFVESVLFYLQLYFQSQGGHLQAHSERQLQRKRKSIRPDISVWRQDELIAIIECKTQLGWNRDKWEQDYLDREVKLKSDFPNAKSFLLVMTENNWGGFGNNINVGINYFSLLDEPTWINLYTNTTQIRTPIEKLFMQLK